MTRGRHAKRMKVLLIGGGGREHALAHGLARDPSVTALTIAPGNGGTEGLTLASGGAARNIDVSPTDLAGVEAAARDLAADLVVIGPEQPLALGLSDRLRAAGFAVFGPSQAAAEIETSKSFAKAFMDRNNIPTARWIAASDTVEAGAFLDTLAPPYVLKADGLAAGKGVVIAQSRAEADQELSDYLSGKFGDASATLVIEEFMPGEEISVFALADGETFVVLPPAQDHKRAFDGDRGPNTGGMGAYTWAPPGAPPGDDPDGGGSELITHVCDTIIRPALDGLRAEGRPYRGVLYAGLMLTPDGPKVVEFNARFGDPETQVIVPKLKTPLGELLMACATGGLHAMAHKSAEAGSAPFPEFDAGAALTVVLATQGYPGAYDKGSIIHGVEDANALPDVSVFHAGTVRDPDGTLRAHGGRVLNVTGFGDTLAQAAAHAYEGVYAIDWSDGFCRRDIGWRALKHEDV